MSRKYKYILGCTLLVGLWLAAAGLAGGAGVSTLAAVQQALKGAPSYHETITSRQNGQTTEAVIEHINPDRWRIISPEEPETIIIGDDAYIKQAGAWRKAPAKAGFGILHRITRQASKQEISEDVVSVKRVGTQLLSGVATAVYKVASDTGDLKGTVKLWVGESDGLPYRIESSVKVPPQPAGKYMAGGEISGTTVFDYSADIKIEAPE
jgi:hypothetical protein